MTEEKRNIELLLLHERLKNGMDRKQIKIYNNCIYVKKLYGEVKDSKFHHSDSLIQELLVTTEHELLQTTQTSSQSTTSDNNNN